MRAEAGAYRRVRFTRRFAIKFPRASNFAKGMRCNRWEREMWQKWRPRFPHFAHQLCPIKFADPFGCVVVMARADRPVTLEEIDAAGYDNDYPDIHVEFGKIENWGKLDGRIVAVDYGLPDADMVRERRAYLARLALNR
jgi:hypothetical protein